MEKYFYTKSSVDSEILTEAIQLRTSVRKEFTGCLISQKKDEQGAILDNNIELHFSRALSSAEHDEITLIINNYGPGYDLVIRKSIEKNVASWARKQGTELVDKLGANNMYRGKTPTQIEALVTEYPILVTSLLTGSLNTAYAIFLNKLPDANITQEEIDEFKLRLEIILGL